MLPQRGDPGFTFAGILALAALSAFMWKAGPLETARPISTSAGWHELRSDEKVSARLWQDPFKAVFGLGKQNGSQEPSEAKTSLPEKIQTRLDSGESVAMVAVMASPGSYAEIEERRRRQRYAVISGLADAGYVPTDPESLLVTTVEFNSLDAQGQTKFRPSCEPLKESNYRLPYEWYINRVPPPGAAENIAVLWLDESWLAGRPYCRLRQMLAGWLPSEKAPTRGRIAFTVVGPARSEGLRDFWEGQREINDHLDWFSGSGLASFSVFSSSATAVPEAIDGRWFERYNTAPEDPAGNRTPMGFTSTVHSDKRSIGELVRELNYRGVKGGIHHVAVISEWDTYYGRYLPGVFQQQYCQNVRKENNDAQPDCNVLRFTYQRGIDGVALRAESLAKSEPKASASDARGPLALGPVEVRRPVGRSQFDYLRRLAVLVREQDRKLRLEDGSGGIRAVAVLGSDVYDKLLILRALRPQLPGTLWLTTDLDAQMLHPDEFAWTRNLIVASSTGMQLRDELNVSVPPFRDNYQSSAYVATRLALDHGWLNDAALASVACTLPMLYEIGRRRPVALSVPPEVEKMPATYESDEAAARRIDEEQEWNEFRKVQRAANVSALGQPSLKADPTVVAVATVLAIALLLVVAYHQSRPNASRRAVGLGAVLLVMGVLTALGIYSDRVAEPFAFNDGVSVWPTIYLRAVATIVAVALVIYAVRNLESNRKALDERYFAPQPDADTEAPSPQSRPNGSSAKPTALVSALFLIVFFVFMITMPRIQLALAEKVAMVLSIWTILAIAWWSYIYRGHSPVRSVNEWISTSDPARTVSQLWRDYARHGEPLHRFMRSVAFMTLYLAFATAVFTLLGSQPSPCRGFACSVDRFVLVASVLSMLFLLFFVVDATRLCAAWIDLMAQPGRAWGGDKEEWFSKALDLPRGPATAWMQVRLIGERTSEVARLIYYPMIVILVMLIARSTYFDDWGFPKALAIVIGLNFAIALGCGVLLRRAACRGRERILDELRHRQMSLAYQERKES